jgi:parallel beta-helix repeat protein
MSIYRILLILIILSNLCIFATDYYVDKNHPSASDSNPGTEALPFATIQKGIDVAYPGDNVFVKYAVYQPGSSGLDMQRSGNQNNPIAFIGLGMPLIQFPNTSSPERGWDWGSTREYLEIHGFEITGSKWAILIRGDHNKIVGNKVHHTGSDGISIWGGSYNLYSGNEVYESGWNALHIESRANVGRPANYNIVEYNYIHDNDAHYGINIIPETSGTQDILYGTIVRYNKVHRCGLFTRKGVDAEIYGNIFYDDGLGENNGIWFDVLNGSHSTPSNTKVYNNTFVTSAETYAIYNVTNSDLDIKNNIVYQEYPAALMYMGNTSSHDIDYNLHYSTETNYAVRWGGSNETLPQFQAMGYEEHGFWSNPLLNSDFTLSDNSPAINAGIDLGPPYNIDMNGNTRGADGFWDIGACEFGLDLTAPEVLGAALLDSITLEITFSESLDPSTAQNPNNYSINNGITVSSASLIGSVVTLNTSTHSVGSYTVTVNNVEDLAGMKELFPEI